MDIMTKKGQKKMKFPSILEFLIPFFDLRSVTNCKGNLHIYNLLLLILQVPPETVLEAEISKKKRKKKRKSTPKKPPRSFGKQTKSSGVDRHQAQQD